MNETELKTILDKATDKVLRGIQHAQESRIAEENFSGTQTETVVLVPSAVPFKEKAFAQLRTGYGRDFVLVAFDPHFSADGQCVLYAEDGNKESILALTSGAEHVILLAPSLALIGRIAEGRDEDFLEYLFLRARLWEKNVSVFLDFDLPSYRRNRYGDMVLERLDALQHLGIPCVCYRTDQDIRDIADEAEARDLITEREVMEDHEAGKSRVICRSDAIITPLAREKAMDLGIEIVRQEVF